MARFAPVKLAAGTAVSVLAIGHTAALPWIYPVLLPLLLAAPLTVLTAHVRWGRHLRQRGWLLVPEEAWSPAVLRRAWRFAEQPAHGR